MGKQPDAVYEGVRVLDARRPDGRAADMGNDAAGIDPGRRLLELLAVIGRPGLLLDEGHAVGMLGHAPAVSVGQALGVALALRHQRVLGVDQAALHAR